MPVAKSTGRKLIGEKGKKLEIPLEDVLNVGN